MKLTEWYGYKQKPVRSGVYETEIVTNNLQFISSGYGCGFSFWDGENWRDTKNSPELAARTNEPIGVQRKMWRGIAK